MIGHNRRYSPHAEKMRGWLVDRAKPAVINYRINAGKVPSDHWVHSDTQGRSRIVGEMTHFLDLMQYLLNEKITTISARRIGGDDHSIVNNDNLVATIQFDRGSVGSLIYTSEGNRALGREYLEIFYDGKTILSSNFRRSQLMAGKKSEKFKTFSQSMGHAEEIKHFINCVLGKASASPFEAEYWTMKMAFALEKSLVYK